MNSNIQKNETILNRPEQQEVKEEIKDLTLENVSMENAAYLQNVENMPEDKVSKSKDDVPTFEVESIELATPKLFSDEGEIDSSDNKNKSEKELEIFESSNSEKNPEMFEELNLEEDFEIPAFLRKQKN